MRHSADEFELLIKIVCYAVIAILWSTAIFMAVFK